MAEFFFIGIEATIVLSIVYVVIIIMTLQRRKAYERCKRLQGKKIADELYNKGHRLQYDDSTHNQNGYHMTSKGSYVQVGNCRYYTDGRQEWVYF